MKGKPDLSRFEPPAKDPTEFLNGAVERPVETPGPAPEPLVQKVFRLRWDTANALRIGVANLTKARGQRVYETELVEDLIRNHFGLPPVKD
jgi:hypothetical protein